MMDKQKPRLDTLKHLNEVRNEWCTSAHKMRTKWSGIFFLSRKNEFRMRVCIDKIRCDLFVNFIETKLKGPNLISPQNNKFFFLRKVFFLFIEKIQYIFRSWWSTETHIPKEWKEKELMFVCFFQTVKQKRKKNRELVRLCLQWRK